MSDRVTPPHVDEIFGRPADPAPHPLDILALDGIDAAREGYRQAMAYRRVASVALDQLQQVMRQRDALRADVTRLLRRRPR